MLKYLNSNKELSSTTLAEVFNQHYKQDLSSAMETLLFLSLKEFVKVKTYDDKSAVIIQITHSGKMYEQLTKDAEKEDKKQLWQKRKWDLATLLIGSTLSIITSIIVNLIMNRK